MFGSLKSKIIVPVVGILIMMVVLIALYVSVTTANLIDGFFDERLEASFTAVNSYLSAYEERVSSVASAMGESSILINLINNGDRDGIYTYLNDKKLHFNVSDIIVTDTNGNVLAGSRSRDFYGDDMSGDVSIAAGLRGEHLGFYAASDNVDMAITSSSPIMDGDALIGVVVVSYDMARNEFLDFILESFNVDATIFDYDPVSGDAYRVASTLINPETNQRAIGTVAGQAVVDMVIVNGIDYIDDVPIFNEIYKAHYFPLVGANGEASGMFFVGIPKHEANAQTSGQVLFLVVVCVAFLVVAILVMFYVVMKSLKPLTSLTATVKEVSNGNFNFNMYSTYIPRDEIGVLIGDVYSMVSLIKSMIDEMDMFNREANVNGDLDYRIDSDRFYGAYKKMLDELNEHADANSKDIRFTVGFLQKISDGDHNIEVPYLPGKKAELSQAIYELEKHIKAIHNTIVEVSEKAAKGNFDTEDIDSSMFKGAWLEMLEGINNFVNSVKMPLDEIRNALSRVGHGLFDIKVKGDYSGEFLTIKNDLNSVIDSLGSYIHEIDRCLNALSSGDLTVKMNMQLVGDFSRIQESVKRINSNLNKTMSAISDASNKVLSSASQISSSAMSLAQGASVQASSVQELNASLDMINTQTTQNAENAVEASTLSDKSTQNAQAGNDSMKQMLEAMSQIKDSSQDISKIIKVIQDIAFQTNLLALNAAVEAARAGEHGKGFAVVAEEVRNLAARSQKAATETTGLIADSINRVDLGSGIAESTAEALDLIVRNADEVLQIINSISKSSKEQSEAIQQVSAGVMQISQVVQDNSATSEETAASADELNSQAELLQKHVAYFKL